MQEEGRGAILRLSRAAPVKHLELVPRHPQVFVNYKTSHLAPATLNIEDRVAHITARVRTGTLLTNTQMKCFQGQELHVSRKHMYTQVYCGLLVEK